jgi:opacity protein-like surface antigen
MKKMFLTMALAFVTMVSSAQFMVVTTINTPEDDAKFEMSNVTDNMGIGYMLNDNVTLGLVKNGEEYDMWGRYYFSKCYAIVQAPIEEMTDNMMFGVGYSLKIWDELYFDPSYMMSMKEDSEGEFKLGLSYKF